ncbi:MAG: TfoX/Sxy family protein [SAR202 cluster bacterium]|nr:TfoX/Sxy family protein [SAR202 cluster bacterium]
MAYSEALAERVRQAVSNQPAVTERKMFGGLAFMHAGNMFCGVLGDQLMVRVGPDAYDAALAQPHARPMDFTGRPMRGMVYVAPQGCRSAADLEQWVQQGLAFARGLPGK